MLFGGWCLTFQKALLCIKIWWQDKACLHSGGICQMFGKLQAALPPKLGFVCQRRGVPLLMTEAVYRVPWLPYRMKLGNWLLVRPGVNTSLSSICEHIFFISQECELPHSPYIWAVLLPVVQWPYCGKWPWLLTGVKQLERAWPPSSWLVSLYSWHMGLVREKING